MQHLSLFSMIICEWGQDKQNKVRYLSNTVFFGMDVVR